MVAIVQGVDALSFFFRPQLSVGAVSALVLKIFRNRFRCHGPSVAEPSPPKLSNFAHSVTIHEAGCKIALNLPALFPIDLKSLRIRDIVRVCVRTSQSRNPTKRYSLASKRKWMSHVGPNPQEKNMTSTTPRYRNWESCPNRRGWEFRGHPCASGCSRGEDYGKADQGSS